jgi:kinesin family protein 11
MGKGGPADNQAGLKIFDDASKKGVFIQGLGEIPVKDAADALALLTKGSNATTTQSFALCIRNH